MKKLTIAAVVLMILAASNIYAAPASIGWRSITLVHTYRGHNGTLYQTDYMIHNGCPSNGWYINPKSHPYYKENHDLLTKARILNRKVIITLEGCFENYPVIRNVAF